MVGLVGPAVERSAGVRRSNGYPPVEFANRRGSGQREIDPGGEARTDPRGMMAGIGMVCGGRAVRASLRHSMVMIGVVLVIAGRLGVMTRDRVVSLLVR